MRILFTWIGTTDLKAAEPGNGVGLGPVAQALAERVFDRAVLLSNFGEQRLVAYRSWLKTEAEVIFREVHLTGPTNFGEIYEAASSAIAGTIDRLGPCDLTFHLSPGTPAMAAVWIILGKTRFPAELIESSAEHGVRTASVPFDISADYIPSDLLRPDERLARLFQGLPPDAPEFSGILHRSRAMERAVSMARRVAVRAVPVLLEGESGTGKELVARAIHRASRRGSQPFVAVNCGAVPPELFESEFFGHRKGAFTGATADRAGHFEAADRGTLFLDELGELPLPAQVKLLRALQEGEIQPVGASKPRKVDVRVIAATNRDLMEEISAGRFREDLYYRLAVGVIRLPPLRQREGDIGLLIDGLIEKINAESASEPGYQPRQLSAGARNVLMGHNWPGNVRELLNTLRRAAVWSPGPTIEAEDARAALMTRRAAPAAASAPSLPVDLKRHLDETAEAYLREAMRATKGNKAKAARLLGLPSYQTLTNWLKRHDVPEWHHD